MKIAVHGRNFRSEAFTSIQQMFDKLHELGFEVMVSEGFQPFLNEVGIQRSNEVVYSEDSELKEVDFLFSVGGDGTMLESITQIREKEIPILGINTGRLGFLATTSTNDISAAINSIARGHYHYDDRSLIHLESNQDIFNGLNFGLNEFTVTKRDSSSMIVVHTYIDGEYLNSYWADGLIISTPTGSTGYSLSCGGPVVLPQSSNFIITPVAPHNLTVRPMIISDSSIISLEVEGRSKNFLISLDSRSKVIDSSVQLAISREAFRVRLIKLNENNFLNTLRNKLNWGLDARN